MWCSEVFQPQYREMKGRTDKQTYKQVETAGKVVIDEHIKSYPEWPVYFD